MIEEAFHWPTIAKVRADNLRRILRLHMDIENAIRFNDNAGTTFAETMAMAATDFCRGVF